MEEITDDNYFESQNSEKKGLRQYFSSNKEDAIVEVKEILALSWPVILSSLVLMILVNTNLLFVGKLGKTELAGVALGIMYINVTGFSWSYGLLSAMETLISQANGAQNYRRVGIIAQRSVVLMTISGIPIMLSWLFSERILIFLRQDEGVAKISGIYIRYMIIGLFPNLMTEIMKRYLQMQGIMFPPIFSVSIAAALNPVFQYIMIFVLKWGIQCSALATVFAQIINFISLFIIIVARGYHKKTWYGWSRDAFYEWKEYLKLGLPGAAMVCLEWGSFEIVALAVGFLHKNELLAAHTVIANTVALCWMVPAGFGVAGSTRVGNFLGAGNAKLAKLSSLVVILLGSICVFLTSAVVLLGRSQWPRLFSEDADVVSAVSRTLVLVALAFTVPDGLQGNMSGILRGCGKQKWGAIINLTAFYAAGVPFAFVSTIFFGWGLYGAWTGLALAEVIIAVGYLGIILRENWEHLAKISHERASQLGTFIKVEDLEMSSVDTKLELIDDEGVFEIEDTNQ